MQKKMTDSSKNTFGSGLYYCYQAQLGAFTQRFGGLVIDKNTDGKYKVNLKNNDALKDGLNYFFISFMIPEIIRKRKILIP